MFKLIYLALLTGCVTDVPCPKSLGGPKEMCDMLIIPTPADPLYDMLTDLNSAHQLLKPDAALSSKEDKTE